jgi:hypothetical protein
LKPAQANSSTRPYLEKTLHKKRVGGVAQGVGPEFKSQDCKKKKKEKKKDDLFINCGSASCTLRKTTGSSYFLSSD